MSEQDFKLGDDVQHKSGGPKMTVKEISEEYGILCTWFDSKKEDFSGARFQPHELKMYEAPSIVV
ncbi:MAG: DUF2158 domain-containing protein [Rhodobacteraceae bacterium]|nr:DUF2158 domain-containing protein [Paracoccaceae bacterium]MCY4139230.1 DUF2158 domain-containing protein [Paracoccaceae bacterium]